MAEESFQVQNMGNKLLKNTIIVSFIVVLGKILSFVVNILITYYFGATRETDCFFVANNVPSIIYTSVISSYIVLFLPTYKEVQVTKGIDSANKYASIMLNILILISLGLTTLGILVQKYVIELIAPGFNESNINICVRMSSILLLSFPFSSISTYLATISNANHKYYASQIIPIISSVISIISIFLFYQYGIYSYIYAAVFSYIIQLIVQIIIVKDGFNYEILGISLSPEVKKIFVLFLPVYIGYSIDQINVIISSSLCTYLEDGSVSCFNYATRLHVSIMSCISLVVITILYPILSELYSSGRIESFWNNVKYGLKYIFITTIPLSFFLCLNSKSIIKLVYGRGGFSEESVISTSTVFCSISLSLLFLIVRELVIRVFYIKNDTKTPLKASILYCMINLLLGIVLMKLIGIGGIALSYLIASIISVSFLTIQIKKDIIDWVKTREVLYEVLMFVFLTIFIHYILKMFDYYIFRLVIEFVFVYFCIFLYLLYRKDDLAKLVLEKIKGLYHIQNRL